MGTDGAPENMKDGDVVEIGSMISAFPRKTPLGWEK
ncbi:MAG: hypothetical protein CM1200mP35_09140 [Chloroflexota bacterium]|nr:MAG: hypothetical protein CM1200mP35_09140 [Chloroflexota bacterium]